ncbi:MAG: threonine--tRNA ligase [Desulfobacula sp.]|jgi:threonyl-tRNA synthetase|uniref:threonine--tRNA ligase n=2 Tax=Desulfobacula sp. TaxID=2593537 RepID=UPI001DCD1958|nr:threonine--tRNA ligase [Desulfobacula sp.]MBT3484355.1 threonine--tRNA ligase [Desulfobacula sp.]MBT3806715.1 threonine--tRNA ligase [Desulfobacula sp.]MBT4024164.1 threonine--tRNA ligase [Desulfobacula sp.]MBT4197488.1 threonine--tRNA ligase [Desulfobacula sp.]
MINITFPDNSIKVFENIPTGMDVAKSISDGFARNCVAMKINEKLLDLNQTIKEDTCISFITANDDEGLEILRHSSAHVMAEAVLNIYSNAKLTIGPVVEDGFYYDIDMDPVSKDDFGAIETEMKKIIKAKNTFERKVVSRNKALEIFKDNPFKLELINELDETQEISLYQNGKFIDLCRGPHIPHTGMIKGFKLLKISGAYWRADQEREQLQRLYGISFFDKKKLNKYINMIEEAKKRDHRKLGTKLDLYSFHDEAAGMPFFHAKGIEVWNALLEYWRDEHKAAGYVETKTPVMLNRKLWEQSGHWENYRENMYTSLIDDEEYAIKPMNCPGGMLLYKTKAYSYRDLPVRAGEIGLVHRHELSGALSGLFRVRAFHQDDAHIFMTPDQIGDEVLGVLKLSKTIYSRFGLDFHLELSTRPKKSIGSDEQWEEATNGLKAALDKYGQEYFINEGDGAFYGPKIDIHIKDALGRTWQCGTVQLDMALPERFDLTYKGRDNDKHRPIMIHRVIYGSLERFFGILVEHFAGRFPLWLAPVQAILLPINQDLSEYAEKIKSELDACKIRCEVDKRSETLKKKIRDAQLNYIPMIITIGDKEKQTGTLSVRTLDGKVRMGLSMDEFISSVSHHVKERILDEKIL